MDNPVLFALFVGTRIEKLYIIDPLLALSQTFQFLVFNIYFGQVELLEEKNIQNDTNFLNHRKSSM